MDFASEALTYKLVAFCFYSSSVQFDSFVLRPPPRTQSPKPLPVSVKDRIISTNRQLKTRNK